jgi:hypothetical protein
MSPSTGDARLRRLGTQELALASILGALSAMSEVIRGPPFDIPFPLLPGVVSWDITGLPMMVSLLLYGPLTAVYTCIVGCSIFLAGKLFWWRIKAHCRVGNALGVRCT